MQARTRKRIRQLLDAEVGTIAKAYGDVRVALVYPNSYRLGMSNLGFQTVYGLINRNPLGRCERSFLFEEEEAVTLESGTTLSSFDVVAFSVSFELDYPNVPEVLRRAKIPLRTEDRADGHPLILAGGAAVMLNPEPVADFVDVFVLGEAETVVDRILSTLATEKGKPKKLVKEKLAQLDGVYVPSFYEARIDDEGRIRDFGARGNVPYPVRRNPPADIEQFSTVSEILTPDTIFSERLLVEVSRGCPRKCKFCGARAIYFPPRWRSASDIVAAVQQRLPSRGKVGLLGASVGEHPEIEGICSVLIEEGMDISVSSVRPGRVRPELARLFARGGVRTLTIAPESGSETMRKRIGKELSNTELVECARIVRESGIQLLKLYFIVGLPGEERSDTEEIVQRVAELSSVIRVNVSISPFVPKARTAYQRVGMRSLDYLRGTLSFLQKEVRKVRGATLTASSPKHALMEGALSRGTRTMSRWLEKGAPPLRSLEEIACRTIPDEEILPWDIVENTEKDPRG